MTSPFRIHADVPDYAEPKKKEPMNDQEMHVKIATRVVAAFIALFVVVGVCTTASDAYTARNKKNDADRAMFEFMTQQATEAGLKRLKEQTP